VHTHVSNCKSDKIKEKKKEDKKCSFLCYSL
jgi:hypothetical protein